MTEKNDEVLHEDPKLRETELESAAGGLKGRLQHGERSGAVHAREREDGGIEIDIEPGGRHAGIEPERLRHATGGMRSHVSGPFRGGTPIGVEKMPPEPGLEKAGRHAGIGAEGLRRATGGVGLERGARSRGIHAREREDGGIEIDIEPGGRHAGIGAEQLRHATGGRYMQTQVSGPFRGGTPIDVEKMPPETGLQDAGRHAGIGAEQLRHVTGGVGLERGERSRGIHAREREDGGIEIDIEPGGRHAGIGAEQLRHVTGGVGLERGERSSSIHVRERDGGGFEIDVEPGGRHAGIGAEQLRHVTGGVGARGGTAIDVESRKPFRIRVWPTLADRSAGIEMEEVP